MNNEENLKRQKLRNNEYYNFQKVQDELYAKSQRGITFKKLMGMITSEQNIKLAYRNIKSNSGSKTSGTDGKTIKHLAKMEPAELIELIRRKLANYQPQKVRRVEIPKENGKTRPLGIPTITDRLIQQCLLQVLEPICEAKFYKHSYGFRPLRSTTHALARAYFLVQKVNLHYVIDIDIKGFFDNIDHGKLLKQIWSLGIRDKQLICVISKLLKAEVEGIGKSTKGTPQGGILSPLLANIALNELDWWIASQWEEKVTRINYSRPSVKNTRLKNTTRLKEVYIVRYADDFKLFCRNLKAAKRMEIAVKQWLKERLKLDANEEKSGIVNLRNQYSEFLGIQFKAHHKGKATPGKEKYIAKSHISIKAEKKISFAIRQHIRQMQRAKDPFKAVTAYNAYMLGIHNYFNSATHCNLDFNDIAFNCLHAFKNRLNLRRRTNGDTVPRYMVNRYEKSKQLRFVYNLPLIPPAYVQHKWPTQYNGISPYIPEDRALIHKNQKAVSITVLKYIMLNPVYGQSVEYNDNRISLLVGQNGRCYVLDEELAYNEIHCHHKKPRIKGGTDEYNNLVIVHEWVHILIHATEYATIQSYLNKLNLNAEQLARLNKLRMIAEMPKI